MVTKVISTNYPITVVNGGTGDSSLTAYAVLCGGTTSTAAVQSIASVGTSGQVLTSNGAGALPTFQAATGGGGKLMLVGSATASNSAAIAFTSGFSYVDYLLVVSEVIPVSAGTFYLQVSTNSGSSYVGSGYAGAGVSLYSVGATQTSSSALVLTTSVGNNAGGGFSGMYELTLNAAGSFMSGVASMYSGSAWGYCIGGLVGPTGTTAIQITNGGGNISSGTFTLYGFKES